jgi:hypothetical protein
VTVLPAVSVPLIVGAALLVGPPAPIPPLAALVTAFVPSAFFAVTVTRSVLPASSCLIVYVCEAAPLMSWQALPFWPQICHW